MPDVSPILFQYGLAGVVILFMAFAIKVLYADGKAKDVKIDMLQEALRTDAKESTEKISAIATQASYVANLLMTKLKAGKE